MITLKFRSVTVHASGKSLINADTFSRAPTMPVTEDDFLAEQELKFPMNSDIVNLAAS